MEIWNGMPRNAWDECGHCGKAVPQGIRCQCRLECDLRRCIDEVQAGNDTWRPLLTRIMTSLERARKVQA